jgi:serine/threonine-protein kinase
MIRSFRCEVVAVSNSQFTANFSTFEAAVADRYIVESEVGRGPRATVYRGWMVSNHEPVAIKVLRADLASALDSARFLKQMQKAMDVRHPGIVSFIDAGEAAGRLFCVTAYLEGETLKSRLAREGTLPLADALAIARQTAEALGHAHASDVMHKDVKPDNILLTGSRARLLDVGLSRAISRSIDETMTGSGLTIGTPEYMSPEHASGGVEIDARADLYSLGCVLYEMLTGKPPFSGGAPHAVLMRTLKEKPVPIATLRDAIPADVGMAIDRMLEKNRDNRYSSASDVIEALTTREAGDGRRETG